MIERTPEDTRRFRADMKRIADRRADRALAWETAELLQDLVDRLRAGTVPRWAIETILPSLRMVRHVVVSLDDRKRATVGDAATEE